MAGCVPKFTVIPGTPVEVWMLQDDGSWSRFDLLGRLQQSVPPCSEGKVLAWALGHAKVTESKHES